MFAFVKPFGIGFIDAAAKIALNAGKRSADFVVGSG